jgi:hypothetical protein
MLTDKKIVRLGKTTFIIGYSDLKKKQESKEIKLTILISYE